VSTARDEPLTCPVCGREFPGRYQVKHPRGSRRKDGRPKVAGRRQLMLIYALRNFERHVRACRKAKAP